MHILRFTLYGRYHLHCLFSNKYYHSTNGVPGWCIFRYILLNDVEYVISFVLRLLCLTWLVIKWSNIRQIVSSRKIHCILNILINVNISTASCFLSTKFKWSFWSILTTYSHCSNHMVPTGPITVRIYLMHRVYPKIEFKILHYNYIFYHVYTRMCLLTDKIF